MMGEAGELARPEALVYNCPCATDGLVCMSAHGRRSKQPGSDLGLRRRAPGLLRAGVSALALVASSLSIAIAGVLNEDDLSRIGRIKPSFIQVMTDVSQSAQRPDLSQAD